MLVSSHDRTSLASATSAETLNFGGDLHGSRDPGRRCTRSRRARKQCCADDEGRERSDLEQALRTGWQLLVEDDEPGGDGDRIRDQGCESRRRQCVAVLKRRLQDTGAERVVDDKRDEREQPTSAVDDELRRDVTTGEEQPRSKSESGAAREPVG